RLLVVGQQAGQQFLRYFVLLGCHCVCGQAGSRLRWIVRLHKILHTLQVLAETQDFALKKGFYVQEMQTKLHEYHLDDAPDLRSCNLFFRSLPNRKPVSRSYDLHAPRLEDFYGRSQNLRVHYVRETVRVDYGKAYDGTYNLEHLESKS
ncbi:MAG: hypothetical protein Q8Q93_25040, partial [Hydrogenophaga sp.]|nr:hypothetical protein [Hydrogenophaga sp.]